MWTFADTAMTFDNELYTFDGGAPGGIEYKGEYQIAGEGFRRLWFDWQPYQQFVPWPVLPGGTEVTLFYKARNASSLATEGEDSVAGTIQRMEISKTVRRNGVPVPGATVRVFRPDEGRAFITDENGVYTATDLDPDEDAYHIVAENFDGEDFEHAPSQYPLAPSEPE